ncbi:PREDICTED: 3-ketoacyl-CoA thiolase A, peroxisomal-like [Miniopterus natalensis]|uniref:3-ketoacyl-CoA thiolase A, peroxisomal-like n=1 Tax=Miniopterus natalensis TaxID=291302 RepID=UPI0007A6BA97|nr:PREDICTED: 3-ketoacyl-CoA thiolase A, peroxisomal-like [Miniopterus natalensis]
MRRLQVVLGHLKGRPDADGTPALQAAPCWSVARSASPEDVVVVHGRRTAIGRGGRGAFKDTTPDELLSAVLTAVLQDLKLSPTQLGDICVGEHAARALGSAPSRSHLATLQAPAWCCH